MIPTWLKHKPVFVVDNYDKVDGHYAGNTDAMGLSLGLAQWNERGDIDISAKIWRYTGEKWSRQSEEIPLHRALDIALLIVAVKKHFSEICTKYDENNLVVEHVSIKGGMPVQICSDNPMLATDIKLFADALKENDDIIDDRLNALANLLHSAGYGSRK